MGININDQINLGHNFTSIKLFKSEIITISSMDIFRRIKNHNQCYSFSIINKREILNDIKK